MARRGENIFKRKDGRWEARVADNRENGKRYYRSLYGKSYTEVKTKKEEYNRLKYCKGTPYPGKSALFSCLAVNWLSSVKQTVKESTYTRYYRNVYRYLIPVFGSYPLSGINYIQINHFKNDLLIHGGKKGVGLSEKTVTDILSVLKMILTYAGEEGFKVVNTKLIRSLRQKKKEISVISKEIIDEMENLLLNSEDNVSLGILLTLHTGIRIGELCGLQWSDFNFHIRTVNINRTVERISNLSSPDKSRTKVIICEPKTENSRREIPLPELLCDYLKLRRGRSDTFLLTGTDKPSEPHTVYIRYKRFLKRNNFDGYTFHALRHTFATRGIASGFDIKSLSELLGHSDVTTTLRHYVHPSAELKRKQMEDLFDSKIRGHKYGH